MAGAVQLLEGVLPVPTESDASRKMILRAKREAERGRERERERKKESKKERGIASGREV